MNFSVRLRPRLLFAASVIAAGLLSSPPVSGQNEKESFTGFAINMNSGPKTATVDFTIERWSPDADREQLLAILQEEKDSYKANEKMLKALQKMPGRLHPRPRLARSALRASEASGGRTSPH
jgi:hypothetical protein